MQHDGSINQATQAFTNQSALKCSFQCSTGGENIRDLLSKVMEAIKDECPNSRNLLRNTEIVLAEVLNNIEEHGYRGIRNGQIELKLEICRDAVSIETTDFGNPMPGLELPLGRRPDAEVAPDDLPEGGFGWFLIHTLAPNPEYRRRGKSNILSIKIQRRDD